MHATTLRTLFAATILAGPLLGQDPPSEETIEYFSLNCKSCHTIGGGPLTGPDLKGFHERRDLAWLTRFLKDPKATLDGGGEYEQQLLQDARGQYMPPVANVTPALASKLFDLIAAESVSESPRFAGVQVSDRPLTDADVERGRRLFLGLDRFESGAPACISCHTSAGLDGLGGGILGPDLTAAYGRLEGRTALAAWLSAPPSPVMQPVFAEHGLDGEEILALVAWMQDEAQAGVAESTPRVLPFVLAGVALAGGLLVLFDLLWRGRFRGVRRPLVHGGNEA